MKKTILLFLPVLAIMIGIASCGNNDTGTGLLGNNTAVTFTMSTQTGAGGGVQFTWQPSVDVKVTNFILSTTGFVIQLQITRAALTQPTSHGLIQTNTPA